MVRHRLVMAVVTLLCAGAAVAYAASNSGDDIAFEQQVAGSINDGAPQLAYRLSARAGDVISADIRTSSRAQASQSAGSSPQMLDSHVTILDAGGTELASSLPGHDKRTFLWETHTTVFAVIAVDGTYTVLAERSPASRLTGDFELTLTKLPTLKVGGAVRRRLTVQDVRDRKFGVAYALQSDDDFFLTYRKTGAFSPTLHVNVVAGRDKSNLASTSGRLQAVAAIAGPKSDFATQSESSAFKGARLLIAGRKEPYVVTLSNNDNYDTNLHLSSHAADAFADCEVMVTEWEGRDFDGVR